MGSFCTIKSINFNYISRKCHFCFDCSLDCLDPSVAPGVANIESAYRGFNMDEARKLIQCLKGKNVIGGDVACLMPTKDNPNQITSMVAAAVMFEIICLICVKPK